VGFLYLIIVDLQPGEMKTLIECLVGLGTGAKWNKKENWKMYSQR
jgi:hypothetical protein